MIYYSDEARNCAKEHVTKMLWKLASTKPNDECLTLEDIRETRHYLSVLLDALETEQYHINRERHEAERKARMEKMSAGA